MIMAKINSNKNIKTWLNTIGIIMVCLLTAICCFVSADIVKQPTSLYARSHTFYCDGFGTNELFPLKEKNVWHCVGKTAALRINDGDTTFEKEIELSTGVTEVMNGNNLSLFIIGIPSSDIQNYWSDINQGDKKNMIMPTKESKIIPSIYRFDIKPYQVDSSPDAVR